MLKVLAPKSGEIYLDATFGGGGYSQAILDAEEDCTVFAVDRDPAAIQRAEVFKTKYAHRFHFFSGCFSSLEEVLPSASFFNGIVADFGVSSFQLEEPERGFSFRFEGPLDMRMSQTGLTAAEVINTFNVDNLAKIFWTYGEESKAYKVAQAIVNQRRNKLFKTTSELADLIRQIVKRKDGLDPATLCFQGLRIFINNELIEIDKFLLKCNRILLDEGKIITVAFHSLEDRIVKNWFNANRFSDPSSSKAVFEVESLLKKPIMPTLKEVRENPRSRSAKLRAFILRYLPQVKGL